RAGDLAALARLHLDVVADRADRHLAEQHRVADLGIDPLTRHDGIAGRETVRRQNVAQFAVFVLDQRNKRRAVRVVLDPLDGRRHVPLATLEVDVAVLLLVSTGHAARSDVTLVVASAGLALAFGQRLDRLALVQGRAVDEDQATPGGAGRVVVLECHRLAPCAFGDIDRLTFGQRHDRLLHVRALVGTTLPALGFALLDDGVHARDLYAPQRLNRFFDLRLGGVVRDLEDDAVLLAEQGRLLGDVRS